MTTWSEGCIWCGEIFYLDDFITESRKGDADAWSSALKFHKENCKMIPQNEQIRKKLLKAMEGMSLQECNKFVKKYYKDIKMLSAQKVI